MDRALEPLRFRRHFVEKVWGGRALATRFGFELPAGKKIGETWELVDRESENSVVEGGPFDGATLRELMRTRGAEILGTAAPARDGRFPLLVKYIDAAEHLSVQIHPDEQAAARLGGGSEAKTEAWYVVDVGAGGKLYAGTKPGVDRAAFAPVASSAGVVPLLVEREVARGDCLLVSGGTVHAIGAGVTILEVQQNSDTTYRLYDWDRVGLDGNPRETHLEQALACMRYELDVQPRRAGWTGSQGVAANERASLVESHLFRMTGLRIGDQLRSEASETFRLYAVVSGRGAIEGEGASWPLVPGAVWLLPASFGAHTIVAGDGALELVETRPGC